MRIKVARQTIQQRLKSILRCACEHARVLVHANVHVFLDPQFSFSVLSQVSYCTTRAIAVLLNLYQLLDCGLRCKCNYKFTISYISYIQDPQIFASGRCQCCAQAVQDQTSCSAAHQSSVTQCSVLYILYAVSYQLHVTCYMLHVTCYMLRTCYMYSFMYA